jgi:hypothetical protein
MNLFKTLAMVGLVLTSISRVSLGEDNSSDKFLETSALFQKAKDEEQSGDKVSSLRDYKLTESRLIEISNNDPSFQKSVIEYRIKKAKDGVSRLSSGGSLPTTDPAITQPSSQQITYQCFIIESDKPIPHDISKLTHRKGIDVMSAPVVTGKVDQQVTVKIVKRLIPKYVNNQTDTQSLEPGLSIYLKGALNRDNIILIGKTQILDVVEQRATAESTSLTTVSNDFYFSKIVKNGEEIWFDVDCSKNIKPKYLTIRIIPALVSSKNP